MWKNTTARQTTEDNITRCMRFACRIIKATDTHSEYLILITFPWQQLLREYASLLRYTYISCLVLRYAFFVHGLSFYSLCTGGGSASEAGIFVGLLGSMQSPERMCVVLESLKWRQEMY
jgi:hypothetical protein